MRAFLLLAREALGDAVRRRIAAVVAAATLLSLLAIDSCTACAGGTVWVNGEPREIAALAGATGVATVVVLALWIVALAGVLASDHLAQTLADGSALLVLARPVGRSSFALARLAGALGVALGAGAVLLGATVALLAARSDVAPLPALGAAAGCGLGALTAAALAMAASLALPRAACALLLLLAVGGVALADALALAGAEPSGALGLVARYGPAFAAAPARALDPWLAGVALGPPGPVLARAALWAAGSVALLLAAFRRVEPGAGGAEG
jgi:hypothetical protein